MRFLRFPIEIKKFDPKENGDDETAVAEEVEDVGEETAGDEAGDE